MAAAFRGHLVLNAAPRRRRADGERDGERPGPPLGAHRSGTATSTWALGAAGLALASIAVALWLARTISRPLKDLAGYAHAVNEGQLDADPSTGRHHGPRETRVAFGVFTDLVANLQLLDAKANALAHCDFDNPILRQPLPGRLGRSLESSVALLSGSIVERDQLQTHLAHLATHDSLTGIFNRPAAITAIQAALQRAARTGATTAVLFVDLNEFKAVNDSHGHEVGDEVLRQVAARMTARPAQRRLRRPPRRRRVRRRRRRPSPTSPRPPRLARRIVDAVSETIEIGTLRIHIGAAVGVALSLDGPEEPLRLLARADAAMYRAKLHERSAIEIFDADLQRQMLEREDIESALTVALADPTGGGLQLHYQPVLDAASGALVGAEALIRWDRPEPGPSFPDAFIPIAEATALIIDLDCWVLAEATRQLVAWSAVADLATCRSPSTSPAGTCSAASCPATSRRRSTRPGIDPRRLIIEITETVLLTDLVAAADELDAVRALGVKVAIDDFGTGYTSLAHLQQLPIDTIKIDRSFISQLNVAARQLARAHGDRPRPRHRHHHRRRRCRDHRGAPCLAGDGCRSAPGLPAQQAARSRHPRGVGPRARVHDEQCPTSGVPMTLDSGCSAGRGGAVVSRILVVDDEPDQPFLLRRILEHAGHVLVATSPARPQRTCRSTALDRTRIQRVEQLLEQPSDLHLDFLAPQPYAAGVTYRRPSRHAREVESASGPPSHPPHAIATRLRLTTLAGALLPGGRSLHQAVMAHRTSAFSIPEDSDGKSRRTAPDRRLGDDRGGAVNIESTGRTRFWHRARPPSSLTGPIPVDPATRLPRSSSRSRREAHRMVEPRWFHQMIWVGGHRRHPSITADDWYAEQLGGGDDDPVPRVRVLRSWHPGNPVGDFGGDGYDLERCCVECELGKDDLSIVLRERVRRPLDGVDQFDKRVGRHVDRRIGGRRCFQRLRCGRG